MRLYVGTSQQFIQDTIQNQIADKLKTAFFNYFRYFPSHSEINSWRNSLRSLAQTFQYSNLLDHGVILEYQLPLTSKRLDCLICGKSDRKSDNAVIVELKQWEKCEKSLGENELLTWIGGAKREVLHPSVQVGQYQMYLADTHTAFNDETNAVGLSACSYLHNYKFNSEDELFDEKFKEAIQKWPLFTGDDVEKLKTFLISELSGGQGREVLQRIEGSKYRPSKKLLDHVGNIVKNKKEYVLLDEQLIVYDKVLSIASLGFHKRRKNIIVIKGGPGTGKSVIAVNLLADLSLKGYNTHYATGSRTFTETLRKIVGRRGAAQFKYFNSYREAVDSEIDILVADEAHRIRETSHDRFTPKFKRTDMPQIKELIRAAKVCCFFIDDNQIVRPGEIGSTEYIKMFAEELNCDYSEYKLEAQFRCNGSEAFVNWVNNTLGIERTANVIWDLHEEFDFRVFDTPQALHQAIKEKNIQHPNSARLVAGFCWPWSEPKPDGSLVNDVKVGSFEMPWEKKDKFWEWAADSSGMDQVGTVYTAQGFEFDYIGVIFCPDLVYNLDSQKWEGHPERSADSMVKRSKEKFTSLIKNVYRVLLSRGMKGCYVYFMDKNTERFFRSRLETNQ
jgi:DUF2075 family protein